MSNQNAEIDEKHELNKFSGKSGIAGKIDSIGWAAFFIWVGFALLLDFGYGIGLVGVGIITLGGQAARKYHELSLEMFWVVVGLLFLMGGFWELFEPRLPLVPILLIIVGIVLLISSTRKKK